MNYETWPVSKGLWTFGLSGFVFLSLVACSGANDNALLTDVVKNTNVTGLNKTPLSSSLALSVNAQNMTVTAGADQIEVAGECFVSTYPSHSIKAELINATTSAVLKTLNILFVQGTSVSAKGSCVQGRYDLIINTAELGSGMNNVRISMRAKDAKGLDVANDANASRIVYIIK